MFVSIVENNNYYYSYSMSTDEREPMKTTISTISQNKGIFCLFPKLWILILLLSHEPRLFSIPQLHFSFPKRSYLGGSGDPRIPSFCMNCTSCSRTPTLCMTFKNFSLQCMTQLFSLVDIFLFVKSWIQSEKHISVSLL